MVSPEYFHETNISLPSAGYETSSDVDVAAVRSILSDMRTKSKSGTNFEYFESLDLLKGQCDELCELFDSFLFIKKNCSRNMDKVVLIKLEAAWGKLLHLHQCKFVSVEGWLAIWLHVIGCPPTVCGVDDFIYLVCDVWLKSNQNFQDLASLSHSLKEIGFRGFLADAIASRVIDIDYFESVLVTIAEPISSNSLIISNNGTLFSVYAVERGSSSLELAGHTELTLHVVDDPPDRPDTKKLLPIPFIIQDMNWQPGRFAEYVYRQIQCMLHNRGHDYCVYGHCTSEQAAVDMSKKGMSPFASGHVMYFFRMEYSEIPFNDLSNGAGERQIDGEQFRTFVYALSIPFVKKDCHPLSPAVLLFLIRKDKIEVFDAVN